MLVFLDIEVADTMTVYWSLRLLVLATMRMLIPAHEPTVTRTGAHITEYALRIAKAVPYCMAPKAGYIGVHRIMFPLRVAMEAFKRRGLANEEEWCRTTLEALRKRGVMFGADIVQTQDHGWK